MGSLNGDTTVVRNGRSTSQISIYNYPEHLNPFYEGDQHKRLRFWKINKSGLNEGRRNSFSISNLKDMWAFKSFRLKKKSSTLGINKTSESPPPLRRDLQLANGWNTFDHRLRPSSNSPSVWNENFERNTICRTSLQNMPSKVNGFGLNRNDNYRSTIQYGGGMRSNYLSPQPTKQQLQSRLTPLQLRSSHGSLVSTNPFDSDNEVNDLNISEMQTSSATSTLNKRTPRKKKRAPAPPTPVLQTSTPQLTTTALQIATNDSSQNNTKDELCIREDGDIANLTAQIENFVETINKENINNTNTDVATNAKSNTKPISTPPLPSPRLTHNNDSQTNQKCIKATASTALKDENDIAEISKTNPTDAITINVTTKARAEENLQQQCDLKKTPTNDNEKHIKMEMKSESTADMNVRCAESPQFSQKVSTIPDKETDIPKNTKNVSNSTIHHTEQLELKQSNIKVIQKDKQTNDHEKHINGRMPSAIPSVVLQKNNITSNSKDPNASKVIIKEERDGATGTDANINNCEQLRIQETIEKIRPPPIPAALRSKSRKTTMLDNKDDIRDEHAQESAVNGIKNQQIDAIEKITTKTSFILVNPPRRNSRSSIENLPPKVENRKGLPNGQPIQHEAANHLVITEDYFSSPKTTSDVIQIPNGQTESNHQPKVEKPLRCNKTNIITVPRPPRRLIKTENTTILSQQQQIQQEQQQQEIQQAKQQTQLNLNIEEASPSKHLEDIKTENNLNSNPNSTSNISFHSPTSSRITRGGVRENEFEPDVEPVQMRNNYTPQQLEWKQSTLAPLETNIPPEKRKSVKDIIESINRSQRLLHTTSNTHYQLSPQLGEKNRRQSNKVDLVDKPLNETQKEIKRLVEEIDVLSNKHSISSPRLRTNSNSSGNNSNNLDKLQNDEIFQKCKVNKEVGNYRETSPTSANLDWNPLPKPKRTKTFD